MERNYMYVTIGCVNPTGTRYCSSWLPYYLNVVLVWIEDL